MCSVFFLFFFSLCLSPSPHFLLSPLPPPPLASSLRLSWGLQAVCLGVGFVSAQKMSLGSWTPTCSWLFAGIQSLSLPGLVQLPNPNHFPQGWRGKEGLEQAGRGDWVRGWNGEGGAGVLAAAGTLGLVRASWDKGPGLGWTGAWDVRRTRTELPPSVLPLFCPSNSTDFGKLSASSSIACTGSGAVPREEAGPLHPRRGCLIPYLVL